MNNRICNRFFGVLLLAVFVFGMTTFVKTEDTISKKENRALNQFEHFTLENFFNGDFQNNFESAISDQFLFSEKIRTHYLKAVSNLPIFGIDKIFCENNYLVTVGRDNIARGIFNCGGNIIYKPHGRTDEEEKVFASNINKYNRINRLIDTYYYFVNDASVMDFSKNQKMVNYPEELVNKLKGNYHFDYLKWDNLDEYFNYFYKTDHHWNYKGSYQGLKDIIKLLGRNEDIQPTGIFTNHEEYFGSHARILNNYDYPEEFEYYQFDLPLHKTYINGEEKVYNHYKEYETHNYEYNRDKDNYYGYVYGGDYGEVIFDYNQPSKENLLIFSNSYSNPIAEVLAQLYNQTYNIDLRYYKSAFGVDFDFDNYIKEHNISKVLFILNPPYVTIDKSNQGLKEE